MQSKGGLRVFDGLFVGDEDTARVSLLLKQDEQFMLLNQITLVINLSNLEIRNYYEHYNIRYINLSWKEFTQQSSIFGGLFAKINENLEKEESLLIHGVGNLDESVTLTAIFIMNKFRWSLYKTLQYLQARFAHLTFSAVSFNLLKICELKLLNSEARLSYNWQIRPENQRQLVLRNTYLNSSKGQRNNRLFDISSKKNKNAGRRVSWNIKQASNPSERSSHRSQVQQTKEDSRRSRVILSVKKIIAQSVNKENKTAVNTNNKGLNKNGEKLKLNKLATQQESSQLMKKYKSFYSLATLLSFEKQQTSMTQQSQKSQISRLPQKLEKSTSQYSLKDRIKTQKSEKKNNLFNNKISLIKTENTDYANLNEENILSLNSSEIISREASFVFKKQKQNLSSVSKISLRKPTPRKKYQISLHR